MRTGIVNSICLSTKHHFSTELEKYGELLFVPIFLKRLLIALDFCGKI